MKSITQLPEDSGISRNSCYCSSASASWPVVVWSCPVSTDDFYVVCSGFRGMSMEGVPQALIDVVKELEWLLFDLDGTSFFSAVCGLMINRRIMEGA